MPPRTPIRFAFEDTFGNWPSVIASGSDGIACQGCKRVIIGCIKKVPLFEIIFDFSSKV